MTAENDRFLERYLKGDTLNGLNLLLDESGGGSLRFALNRAMYGPADDAGAEQIREQESAHLARLSGLSDDEKATALYNLGCFALVQDDVLAAQMRFAEALRVDPDNLMARHNLAYAHELLAETAEAQEEYEAILARNPGSVLTRLNLAQLKLQAGDYEQALDDLQALHSQDPDNAGVLLYLCRGLLLRGTGADIDQVLELVNNAPDAQRYVDLQECRAYALYLQGDADAAELEFNKLLENDAENLFARLGLIKIFAQRGDFATLATHVEQLQARNPSDEMTELLAQLNLAH